MRIELYNKPEYNDGRALRLAASIKKNFGISLKNLAIIDVFVFESAEGLSDSDLDEVFVDHVAQGISIDNPVAAECGFDGWSFLVEIAYKAGVTDPVAATARDALVNWREEAVTPAAHIRSARQYLFDCPGLDSAEQAQLAGSLFNPLIETALVITKADWEKGKRAPASYSFSVPESDVAVRDFALDAMDDAALEAFSREKLFALNLAEMKAVQNHFSDQAFCEVRKAHGLGPRITDVEMEMIAQTWSEHCKHKIFNAVINYTENGRTERIASVFKTFIKRTTEIISKKKKYLQSVFYDNSGVIRFDKKTSVCFKVETHNSPSALDPYGGAITGIVGVNRDILGTGKLASPIFNTNVLCFADPDTAPSDVPQGFLPPRRIMEGVHRGIIDGGNQSGIPVVGGAFVFDESYIGKPLVFCGTGGLMPARLFGEETWIKHIKPGDLAVMTGGRIGKDGIHGATFSSLALDEDSPTSAVQIGDPFTQKKMWDFLEEARDRGLFAGITDNGAGGLSSSLGEMAQACNGVRILLDNCPLKYQGLAPWEILVSESQERMSLAVSRDNIDEFLALSRRRDVEATVVGEFSNTGFIEILYGEKTVGLIDLQFLHEGLPVMELSARWEPPVRALQTAEYPALKDLLLKVLSHPNVCSRENLVRQYDHEVQGCSIVKPMCGAAADAPSDGAVFKPSFNSYRGLTITHGICPRLGDYDTYHMAACALDEAFRSHVALGGDPKLTAALDNFCWPDPVASKTNPDGEHKLAQLVRAARGLKDSCLAYGIPLISGKDSMKNDAFSGTRKISIRPTLLVSLLGIISDVRRAVTSDLKKAGHIIYILGMTEPECGGSILEQVAGRTYVACPTVKPTSALRLYKALARAIRTGLVQSCHDISDGGMLVTLIESAIGGRLGFEAALDYLPRKDEYPMQTAELCFCESPSRFIISLKPRDEKKILRIFRGLPAAWLGTVTRTSTLAVAYQGETILEMQLEEALAAWKGGLA